MFARPAPNSLVVQVVTEKSRQQHPVPIPEDIEAKCLGLLSRKVFTSTSIQFRVSNYQALLAKYDLVNYSKFSKFKDKLPSEDRTQFQAFLAKGMLVTRTSLQATVDALYEDQWQLLELCATNLRCSSQDSRSGGRSNQHEDLPFDENHLFNEKTEYLHALVQPCVPCGIYTLVP